METAECERRARRRYRRRRTTAAASSLARRARLLPVRSLCIAMATSAHFRSPASVRASVARVARALEDNWARVCYAKVPLARGAVAMMRAVSNNNAASMFVLQSPLITACSRGRVPRLPRRAWPRECPRLTARRRRRATDTETDTVTRRKDGVGGSCPGELALVSNKCQVSSCCADESSA